MRSILRLLIVLAAGLAAACARPGAGPGEGAAQVMPPPAFTESATPPDWRSHFADISGGAILIETDERRLTWWSPGGGDRLEFPVGVARAPELGRTGRTRVVARRTDPSWTPTPAMRRRDPSLPAHVPPGPANPMGRHALYLGWQYYAIHGTNDVLSVGRATSSGCFRLLPEDAETLYRRVRIGTQVHVL
jgi:L,D-transpeptidase ErfK/SrfK